MKFFTGVLFGILGAIGIRWWMDEFDAHGNQIGGWRDY